MDCSAKTGIFDNSLKDLEYKGGNTFNGAEYNEVSRSKLKDGPLVEFSPIDDS